MTYLHKYSVPTEHSIKFPNFERNAFLIIFGIVAAITLYLAL